VITDRGLLFNVNLWHLLSHTPLHRKLRARVVQHFAAPQLLKSPSKVHRFAAGIAGAAARSRC
jgi:hypothetical protein